MRKLIFIGIILAVVIIAFPVSLSAQSPTVSTSPAGKKVRVSPKFKATLTHLTGAKVESISGSSLTVSKEGKSYTVTTASTTRYRRHFWGKSSLSEISVGDNVNIWGKWVDEAQSTINASLVRDTSIMRRFGVFIGTVKSKAADNFVLQSVNRGDQTVYFDANTKFVNRKMETIKYDNVNVGDRVKVKGLWDKTLSKITQVAQVKDFSQPTPSPTK